MQIPQTIGNRKTAQTAWEKSCYFKIDFKIEDSCTVYEAVQRFAAYNIGCLVVSTQGKVSSQAMDSDRVSTKHDRLAGLSQSGTTSAK